MIAKLLLILILLVLIVLPLCKYKENLNKKKINKILRYKKNNYTYSFSGKINNTTENTKFILIVPFFNPGIKLLKKCIYSIKKQKYKNYDVCFINDNSTKESNEIDSLIKIYTNKYNWKYIKNENNHGPMYSRLAGIDAINPSPEDVIVTLDGDDSLSNMIVLNKLNLIYTNENVLVTFGNFIKTTTKGKITGKKSDQCNLDFNDIINNNKFREYKFFSHLKTFKFKLLKHIDRNVFKRDCEYIRSATDVAIITPLLELSGNRIACVDDTLYKYTIDNPISFMNNKKTLNKQTNNARYIQSLAKYSYKPDI